MIIAWNDGPQAAIQQFVASGTICHPRVCQRNHLDDVPVFVDNMYCESTHFPIASAQNGMAGE
jgi:hypothetical protein